MKLLDVIHSPWAITEAKLNEIVGIYHAHVKGPKIDLTALEAQTGLVLDSQQEQSFELVGPNDDVALIEINGVMGKRMNLFTKISGGASTEIIGNQIAEAVNDDGVKAIVLRIDSPGGTVDGTKELADLVFSARGIKPIVTFVDGSMMSAALWVGMASDRVVASSPVAMVGSLGVIATHVDVTRMEENAGIKTTNVVTGKFKALGSPSEVLTEDGRAEIQRHIDSIFSVFVEDIARFRGVDSESVLQELGDARIVLGQAALDSGIVDGVSTLEEVVESLTSGESDDMLALAPEEIPGITIVIDDPNNQQGAKDMGIKKTATNPAPDAITSGELDSMLTQSKNDGFEEGLKSGMEQGLALGRNQESARIKGVLEHSMAGHEDLVNKLAFDGETSPDAAAAQVLKAEKSKVKDLGTKLDAETNVVEEAETPETVQDLSSLPFEERVDAEWARNSALHDEFSSKETYAAYLKAEEAGRIKEG